MNDFEKIVSITEEKFNISDDFLNVSLKLKDSIEKNDLQEAQLIFDERQELIETVNILDKQFLTLYEKIKSYDYFENEIKKYPKLFEYISKIRDNFKQAYDIDMNIMPFLEKEFDDIKKELKSLSNQTKVSDKYGQEAINKVTSSNFGVFFDEKK